MQLFLIILAAAGLLGCFIATFGMILAGRGGGGRRRLTRPRKTALRYEFD